MTTKQNYYVSRRKLVSGTAAALCGGLAGCSGGGDGDGATTTPQPPTPTGSTDAPAADDGDSTDSASATDCSSPELLEPADVTDGASLSNGCYRADQTLAVENGVLELGPGVVIEFASKSGLAVKSGGALRAEGSESAPVRLTGSNDSRGSWKGVRFKETTSAENRLEHTIIEDGGDSRWHGGAQSRAGLFLQNAVTLTVRNVTLRNNAKVGLTATGGNADLTVGSTAFENNETPVWIPANLAKGIEPSNAFSNNDNSYVYLGFGTSTTDVTDSATWPAHTVPYRAKRTISVAAPLRIRQGATLEFEQDKGMRVHHDGRLSVEPSGDGSVVFTGVENIPGYWRGLYFIRSLSTDNVLRNVVIEYGGSSRWHGGEHSVANLFLRGGGKAAAVDISNSTIRGSAKYGICKEGKARVMGCDGMLFENNEAAPTYNSQAGGPISSCQ